MQPSNMYVRFFSRLSRTIQGYSAGFPLRPEWFKTLIWNGRCKVAKVSSGGYDKNEEERRFGVTKRCQKWSIRSWKVFFYIRTCNKEITNHVDGSQQLHGYDLPPPDFKHLRTTVIKGHIFVDRRLKTHFSMKFWDSCFFTSIMYFGVWITSKKSYITFSYSALFPFD